MGATRRCMKQARPCGFRCVFWGAGGAGAPLSTLFPHNPDAVVVTQTPNRDPKSDVLEPYVKLDGHYVGVIMGLYRRSNC